MSKIVVVGGTGRVGALVVAQLRSAGHDALAASPSTGVDAASGIGLAALSGADAVVDVSKPRTYDDAEVFAYFRRAATNLAAAERDAGVGHHILLAAVGTGRPHGIAYYRAKAAGEEIVRSSGIPFSFVHATQFFGFFATIADSATRGDEVRLPGVLVQPIAEDDVATAVCGAALAAPSGGVLEVAGPERFALPEFVRRGLAAVGDPRRVTDDPEAEYFGGRPGPGILLPGAGAHIASTRFADWLRRRAG